MFNNRIWIVLLTALFLAACGGGGGGGSYTGGNDTGGDDDGGNNDDDGGGDGDDDADDTLTGVFVDSAVGGIGYRTETQEGETNADGEFAYVDGETVTFFIGDVELPAVAAGGMITPLDVFETEDFTDQRVTNLARLLQSLDEDGDPENGITLGDAAHSAATGVTLDFDVPVETFAANADVINLVSNGGGPGTLVPAEEALSHLLELSLVGSWVLAEEEAWLVATFMPDGSYMIAEGEAADDAGQPGIEYGTYDWDPLTGAITVTPEVDTNGEWGLSHPQPDTVILRDGAGFVVRETIDGAVEETAFVRVESADSQLVGGWVHKSEDTVIVLVFTDMHYAHAEIAPESGDGGETGPEFGSYTWNAETGLLSPLPEADFNGSWGPSSAPSLTTTFDGDTLLLDAGDGVLEVERVK